MPAPLKSVIDLAIKEAGKSNVQTFFNISLTAMATDMSRGSPALGHKLLLQYIALNDPESATANLSNYIALKNSYQNRPPVGLSILWAVGQVGAKDLHLGLKVYNDLMLPLIEMKNYSRYIVEYLLYVLRKHNNEVTVTKEEFLLVLDTVFSKRKFPPEITQKLNKAAIELSALLNRNKTTKSNVFVELLIKKLLETDDSQNQKILCELFVSCLVKDQASFGNWNKIYAKNLPQSAALLNHMSKLLFDALNSLVRLRYFLGKNWKSISRKINTNQLRDALAAFSGVNQELQKKKRKETGLGDVIAAIEVRYLQKQSKCLYNCLFS